MHYVEVLPDGSAGAGRQILPHAQTREEWEAAGRVVGAEPYDAHAISHMEFSERVYDERGSAVQEQEMLSDRWSVWIRRGDEAVPEFEVDKAAPIGDETRYAILRDQIEERLGRTGLLIIVS